MKRALKEDEACDRVCKALEDTRVVHAPSSPKRTAGFVVRHYAGPVKYDAKGLLHKNKDEVRNWWSRPFCVAKITGFYFCFVIFNFIFLWFKKLV